VLGYLDQPAPQAQLVTKVVPEPLVSRARLAHQDRPVCQAHEEAMGSPERLEPRENKDRKDHRDPKVNRETEVRLGLLEQPDRLDRTVRLEKLEQLETRVLLEKPVLLALQVVRVHQGSLDRLVLLDHQDLLDLPDLGETWVRPDLLDHRDRLVQEDLQVQLEVLVQLVTTGVSDQLDLLVLRGAQVPVVRKEKRAQQEKQDRWVNQATMVFRVQQVKLDQPGLQVATANRAP
jgi:hypothetical protein